MAHRGRLNVLAHTVGRPYESMLVEFEGEQTSVGRHRGARGRHRRREVPPTAPRAPTRRTAGKGVTVTLSPNPSHLEYVNPVVEGRARADQTSRKGRELTHDPSVVAAGPDPRRRRLPGPGRRRRDAQPAGAARLLHRRHGPHHRQQPARLHHRPARLPLDALRVGPRQGLRHADHPRERRRRGGLHRRRPAGDGLPRALRPRRPDRPDRLPPLRPQRDRRARLHAAADVRADQGAPAGAQDLRRASWSSEGVVTGRGGRRDRRRPPTSASPTAHARAEGARSAARRDDRRARARPHDEPRAATTAVRRGPLRVAERAARARCPTASPSTASSSRSSRSAARRSTRAGRSTGRTPRRSRSRRCSRRACRSASPARTPSAAPSASATWCCTTPKTGEPLLPAPEPARAPWRRSSCTTARCRSMACLGFEYGYSVAGARRARPLGGAVRRLRELGAR